jgi:hypothetical protein
MQKLGTEGDAEQMDPEDGDEGEEQPTFSKDDNTELRFLRLENLIARRPFLVSNTVLKQNPHNVYEWLNRIKLSKGDHQLTQKAYEDAIE